MIEDPDFRPIQGATRAYEVLSPGIPDDTCRQVIESLEHKGKIPDTEELLKVSKALHVTMEWLLTGKDPPRILDPSELPQPRVTFATSLVRPSQWPS